MPNSSLLLRVLIPLAILLAVALLAEHVSLRCGGNLSEATPVAIAVFTVSCLGYLAYSHVKCQRFQYSLRTLLVVVTIVAVVCSFCVMIRKAIRYHQQAIRYNQAVAAIEGFRNIEYGPVIYWSGEGVSIDLAYSHVRDVDLDYLNEFSQLRWLSLFSTNVTDAGLVHAMRWTNLEALNLGRSNVTGLKRLQELNLEGTQVTDIGLEQLKGLTHLQKLHIERTRVTNEGAKKLGQALPNCTILR